MAGQVQHVHELLSELETETIYSLDIQKNGGLPADLKVLIMLVRNTPPQN